ncbi:hypothetical protein DCAR_0313476 [Daucus carota subsp. sativus]|uniref:Uncharacterized protein n=1 Tax=Daucus carota subsp. sativus TaxID=79200 RepID=A0A166C1U7_DAUCS|nr:hypothetical protein DCAR_0313476 [Daucus carota subsp. sativus]
MSGNITYNGHGLKEFVPRRTSAYVSRQDWHVPEMTMRETLDFSARCQGVGCKYANIRAGVPGAGLNPRSDNISGSDITEVGNMVQSPLAGQFCKGSTQPFQPSPSARRLSEVDLSGTYHAEFVIKYKQEF